GTAMLGYHLDEDGPVSMTIFDVKGRRVANVLAGETRSAGENESSIDTTQFPPGVYFIKLQTKTKMVSRKMVVVH
ncbi:unnamed protein product, partial [marine sediment metagenome]